MQIRNTPDRWGAVQQTLHWLVVPLALVQLGLGMAMDDLPREALGTAVAFGLHASLGLTIGAVMVMRFLWRLVNPVPLMPERLGRPARAAVYATHYGFYLLLMFLPATGYLMASARGYTVPFFAWTLPNVVGPSEGLAEAFLYAHLIGVNLIYLALALHIAGALRHEFVLRDNTFRRMTPLPPREGDHRARTTRRSSESESLRRGGAGGRT
jgi:cytochrome b561